MDVTYYTLCGDNSVRDVCFQLPIRTGLHTTQSIQNVEQNKECLIQVSRHKFPLVINGLTKTLQSVDSMVSKYSLWTLWSVNIIVIDCKTLNCSFDYFWPTVRSRPMP